MHDAKSILHGMQFDCIPDGVSDTQDTRGESQDVAVVCAEQRGTGESGLPGVYVISTGRRKNPRQEDRLETSRLAGSDVSWVGVARFECSGFVVIIPLP